MEVEDFIDEPLELNAERVEWIKQAIESFPLYQGVLVGEEGTVTMIVAELIDDSAAQSVYSQIETLV